MTRAGSAAETTPALRLGGRQQPKHTFTHPTLLVTRPLLLAAGLALASVPAAAQTGHVPVLSYRLPGQPLATDDWRQAARVRPDSLRPPPDDWLGFDKGLHVGASLLLTLSGQYVLTDKGGLSNGRALPLAAGTALALGLAKEVADSRRAAFPLFSLRDLAADVLGVAVGALVTRL